MSEHHQSPSNAGGHNSKLVLGDAHERCLLHYLSRKLVTRPEVVTVDLWARETYWKTTTQMLGEDGWWDTRLHGARPTADELDLCLLEKWENDERFAALVRPAKYPDALSVRRFWSLTEKVGYRNPDENPQRNLHNPRALPQAEQALPPNAWKVFLSHCHGEQDARFVEEVRRWLNGQGVSVWLAEERIPRGEPITEAVRAALESSDERWFLLTNMSLGSAWGWTELGSNQFRPGRVVIDGRDQTLLNAINAGDQTTGRTDHLAELQRRYDVNYNTLTEHWLSSASSAGVGYPRRPDKFIKAAAFLLQFVDHLPYRSPSSVAVFPDEEAKLREVVQQLVLAPRSRPAADTLA